MTDFDKSLPHQLPWDYPWIKDEIERRDDYIDYLEHEIASLRPIECERCDEMEDASPDSRGKLLADLEELVRRWRDYDGNWMRVYSSVAYAQVKELLDRQAAITERECKRPNWDYCETCELEQQVGVLRSQRNAMARKLAESNREKERYRAAIGRAKDLAHEIGRI